MYRHNIGMLPGAVDEVGADGLEKIVEVDVGVGA